MATSIRKRFSKLKTNRNAFKQKVNNAITKRISKDSLADLVNVNFNLLLNATFVVALALVVLFINDDISNPTGSMAYKAANWTRKFDSFKPYGDYLLEHNSKLHAIIIFAIVPAAVRQSNALVSYAVAVFWAIVSNPQSDLMYYFTAWVMIVYTKLYKRNPRMSAILTAATLLLYLFFFTKIEASGTPSSNSTASFTTRARR